MHPVAALALLAVLAAPLPPDVPPDAAPTPEVRVLVGNFVPGAQPDGNTVVFRAPAGLVVVDTGRHEAHAQRVLDLARRLGAPVAVVVNTHWHLDHVSGNPVIRRAFPAVEVVGSRAIDEALVGFLATYRSQLVDVIGKTGDPAEKGRYRDEVARIDAGRALAPDHPIDAGGQVALAGRSMELGLERHAVTAADVWVFDRPSGILAAGDLVTLPAPLLDTACPRGWKGALARLSGIPFLLLVPGHGRPMSRTEFESYRVGFDHLVACAETDQPGRACIDGWLRDLGPLVPDSDQTFARDLLAYYVQDVLRAPPERVARLCGEEPGTGTVR
jgi:glyoxylase-like metal-dependent hydrolase (beta-lactamase superfamily II)